MNSIKRQTGFAKSADGTPIFYEVRGEGKPLVLCYGIACLMNHWHHQVKYFSNHYKVITLDYRGHHQSGAPEDLKELSIDRCVEDIKTVVDHLGIEQASFWGHSWGCQLLTRAYDLHPKMFTNLVLVNGFVSNPIRGMFGTNIPVKAFEFIKNSYGKLPVTSSYLWKKLVYNPIAVWFTQASGGFNPQLTAIKDIEVYLKGVSTIEIGVFLTLFEAMMNYDGRNVLDHVDVPTLIIAGEKDFVTPLKYQETMHRRIKGAELTKVPYGSHCTMLDMPEFVNIRIEKFLKEHSYF